MAVSARALDGALATIVGADHCEASVAVRERHAVDGRVPRWVVRTTTTEQVSRVLALAYEERLAVVPRGSGSALTLGAPPERVDVVLDVRGLDRVREHNPEDLVATVEAGVTLGHLNRQVLGPRGQRLPIDPPAGATRTLGGIVATNASGPLRARFGTMRDLLLGVRFVQADGVVTWGGARVVKSVTGYDVPKLLVGSLGTLGVVTELTLRLHPRPDVERTWLARFSSVDALQACLGSVIDSSIQPSRVELFDGAMLRQIGGEESAVALAVSIASVAEAVGDQGVRFSALATRAGGRVAEVPDSVWGAAERALLTDGDAAVIHVASLPAALAVTLRAIDAEVGQLGPGARAMTTGGALLGLTRLLVRDAEPVRVATLVERLRAAVAGVSGSVIIERAPLAVRELVDPWGPVDPAVLAVMRAIKDELDHERVLNPGRFVGGL